MSTEMSSIAMYCLVGYILGELFRRLYIIIKKYYEDRSLISDHKYWLSVQWRIHKPNNQCCTFLLICITCFLLMKTMNMDLHITRDRFYIMLFNSTLHSVIRCYKFFESRGDVAEFLNEVRGLDYGSGMAYSYFYGYLSKILPDYGDNNVGIRENIEKYEAKENITISVKRLFILIPLSMYFAPSLVSHAPEGIMEACKSLESVTRNVAGVIGRPYKNTVYKIHLSEMSDELRMEKPLYVVAEGATPLYTLYQTCTGNAGCTATIKEYSEEIVKQFYITLEQILESLPEYKNTYEIILYKGDENLAELLVQRIRNSDEYNA